MKKALSLLILSIMLAFVTTVSASTAETPRGDIQYLFYGDYKYILEDGKATIVGSVYGIGDSMFPDRPGMADPDTTIGSRDDDGQWHW